MHGKKPTITLYSRVVAIYIFIFLYFSCGPFLFIHPFNSPTNPFYMPDSMLGTGATMARISNAMFILEAFLGPYLVQ